MSQQFTEARQAGVILVPNAAVNETVNLLSHYWLLDSSAFHEQMKEPHIGLGPSRENLQRL